MMGATAVLWISGGNVSPWRVREPPRSQKVLTFLCCVPISIQRLEKRKNNRTTLITGKKITGQFILRCTCAVAQKVL